MCISGEIEISYKDLIFKLNKEINYLEVVIDEYNFSPQKNYISSVSLILEYALTVHPRYLILNREKYPFKVASQLFSFTSNNIISPLKLDSIKKILCIGTEEEYKNRYVEIEKIEPFIKWVDSKASALEWIKNEEVKNQGS